MGSVIHKTSLILRAVLVVSLIAIPSIPAIAVADEVLKPSAKTELSDGSPEIKQPMSISTFRNAFPITAEGDLAKEKATEMLGRYPSLTQNPYGILVKFNDDALESEVTDLLDRTNTKLVHFYPTINSYLVEATTGSLNAERDFKNSDIVDVVEVDSVSRLNSVNTNDPLVGSLWGLNDNHGIDAPVAWSYSTSASEVVVAVIDTGVETSHPDLSNMIWVNPNEIPDNGIDDDGNGYIDDTSGWDFLYQDNTPDDRHGHGTHVAGTIAATRNNGEGIAGVANNVKIMPIKILGLNDAGEEIAAWDSRIIEAIEYAHQNGAKISNNSWGGGGQNLLMKSAIDAAGNNGHLFVAAAGNYGSNNDIYSFYPASYSSSNILSVAAIASDGNLAGFSNYGVAKVDLAAPGVSILSTMSSESNACTSTPPCYVSWGGTSMAAPHASGVAALALGINNGISPEEIIQIMGNSIRPTSVLDSKVRFGGELNGGGALILTSQFTPSGSITFVDYYAGETILQGSAISLTATATGADGSDLSQSIEWVNSDGIIIGIGSSVSLIATDVGPLTMTARVSDLDGSMMAKTASFQVVPASLDFTNLAGLKSGSPNDSIVTAWSWTGPEDETSILDAISVEAFQLESVNSDTYALPDNRTPVDMVLSSQVNGIIEDVIVGVRINHTWPADLRISLIHPDGTEVTLADNNGNGNHRDGSEVWGVGSRSCSGELAYFADDANESIAARAKPFSGFSIPVESLNAFDGKQANGDWIIRVVDEWSQDAGVLYCAQILLTTTTPTQTVNVSNDVSLSSETASWTIPDPLTFSGLFRFFFPNTSLGDSIDKCCIQLGLPEPPLSVLASRISGDQIQISWNANSPQNSISNFESVIIDAFQIGQTKSAGSCISSLNSCTISGLIESLEYELAIRGVNGVGAGPAINISVGVFDNQISQGNTGLKDFIETNDQFGTALASGDFNGDGFDDLIVSAHGESTTNSGGEGIVHAIFSFPDLSNNLLITRLSSQWDSGFDSNFGSSLTTGDFNGDGFDDLIVGVPSEDIESAENAGMIQVFYGGLSPFSVTNTFHQNSAGVSGSVSSNERFGASVASGDLNADGYDDVVIGVPGEFRCWNAIDVCGDVGGINILYGSANGITAEGNEYITQRTNGISGAPNVGEEFGASVATGDLDGDGYDDIVVGVPGEYRCWSHIRVCGGNIGAIQLLYGSENGIRTDNDQYFGQRSNGVTAHPSVGDRFGASVSTGDIDGDGYDDVVLGIPGDYRCWPHIRVCGPVGAIMILYGTENGTTSVDDDYWGQRSNGVPGYVGVGDEFGAVVTTGDLNEDGYDDVIIGVPGETVSSRNDAGAVQILYGSATGSITDGAEMLYVSQSAFTGTSQTNARFGSAITAIGNDLIIGAPGNTVSGITAAGSIYHHTP